MSGSPARLALRHSRALTAAQDTAGRPLANDVNRGCDVQANSFPSINVGSGDPVRQTPPPGTAFDLLVRTRLSIVSRRFLKFVQISTLHCVISMRGARLLRRSSARRAQSGRTPKSSPLCPTTAHTRGRLRSSPRADSVIWWRSLDRLRQPRSAIAASHRSWVAKSTTLRVL